MRWLIRSLLAVIAVIVAIPTIWIATLWFDAGATIANAERTGRLAASSGPLTTSEHTISTFMFHHSWYMRPTPCRSVAALWRAATSGGRDLPGAMSVAAELARDINQPPERSMRRQFEEITIACRLEHRYDDTSLLRAWLAQEYFGQPERGIEHAAQAYFGKPAADLDANESAHIAALLRSPRIHREPERWTEHARRVSARVAEHDLRSE